MACRCDPGCRCESVPLRSRDALLAAIRNAGSSQRALARDAGVTVGMVSQLATGRRTSCTLGLASAIAEALGVDVGVLFDVSQVSRQAGRTG